MNSSMTDELHCNLRLFTQPQAPSAWALRFRVQTGPGPRESWSVDRTISRRADGLRGRCTERGNSVHQESHVGRSESVQVTALGKPLEEIHNGEPSASQRFCTACECLQGATMASACGPHDAVTVTGCEMHRALHIVSWGQALLFLVYPLCL